MLGTILNKLDRYIAFIPFRVSFTKIVWNQFGCTPRTILVTYSDEAVNINVHMHL